MPPAFVKPYVKRSKNDAVDAEAICEAVIRPTMRFVAMKSTDQQAALSLHRVRDVLVKQRTQLVNMIRGLLAQFGIDIPVGLERALGLARQIASNECEPDVPAVARQILNLLCVQVLDTHVRLQAIDRAIIALQRTDEVARRLSTIPGVGPVGATAWQHRWPIRRWQAAMPQCWRRWELWPERASLVRRLGAAIECTTASVEGAG